MFFGQARFSLVSIMTTMLACDLTLEQVVPMATSNPARMLRLENDIDTLKPGVVADVSVLHDERGRWVLHDNEGTQVSTNRMLLPAFCLRAGQCVDADAPILTTLAHWQHTYARSIEGWSPQVYESCVE
jgi:dihydroorotase